jgi:tetratricopeptide (TPR) repeat protein
MKRSPIVSTVIVLALSVVTPVVVPVVALGTFASDARAQAQDDREKKEERRVLKLSEVDTQSKSDAYRQLAREKRHESMKFLKDILANRNPQGTQKAEMLLRLAELYYEEHRDLRLDEEAEHLKRVDQCFNTAGCDTDTIKANYGNSRGWAEKAVVLYKQILDNYPQYQRADEATFFLASTLGGIDEKDQAVEEYTRLVRAYPESKYMAAAFVQIGEYYFDTNVAFKALQAYKQATRYKDSEWYAFANYKLAWCYYNVSEYGKAIETMKGVVAFSMTGAEGQSEAEAKKRVNLQEEALKDLVRFFADAGELDEAYDYLVKLGRKDLIRTMLKRLASTYFEQGKFEECIQTYRRLIADNPQSPEAPEYQNEVIGAYQKMGRKEETAQEIERLRKDYGKSSAWARANSANQDAVKASREFLEKNLRTVAVNYHNEARKLGAGARALESYRYAGDAYAVYLEEFPDGKYVYQMRFEYGELLYKLKKYPEAYAEFMAVVKLDANGKESQFCARSAVYAAEEVIKAEAKAGRVQKASKGKTDILPLNEWEEKKLVALDQFAKLYPDHEDTKGMIYEAGYIYYDKNRFKDASDRFRTVITMDPKSKQAMQAANLIVDSFALVEDYENLKDVSKAFYEQQSLGNPEFKKEMLGVYEKASLKLVDVNFQKDKDQNKAAVAYMAFYAEFPKSEDADFALNNAAFYFYQTGQAGKSMEARHALIENFPKSKHWKGQVAALGYDYESIADFDTAATWYEKLYETDPAFEKSKEAIFSAALFRRAQRQNSRAVEDLTKFRTTYPDDPRSLAIPLDIAGLYEEEKNWDEAARYYMDFYMKPPAGASVEQTFYARLQYGKALEASNQTAKADKHWKETVAAYDAAVAKGADLGTAAVFVAEIKTTLARPQLERYLGMKISGPGKKLSESQTNNVLKDQLFGKIKALGEVEKTYADIIKMGAGEWGLASLVQLGKAYEDMSESLLKSYIPDYMTDDQKEIYRMGLEDKAYVQVDKAINAYAEGLKEAYNLNLYNENTAYATRRLGELRPDDFPVLVEELSEARFTARSSSGRTFESQP